jgi:amino acid transporter
MQDYHQVIPSEHETLLSVLGKQIFGVGIFYYYLQAATLLILLLAANTSYADFPRLCYFLARDGYLPRQLSLLGDRLVYSNGINLLSFCAALLIIIFRGNTSAVLPLYAVGVFTSFTLSQLGMVIHWFKERGKGWQLSAVMKVLVQWQNGSFGCNSRYKITFGSLGCGSNYSDRSQSIFSYSPTLSVCNGSLEHSGNRTEVLSSQT